MSLTRCPNDPILLKKKKKGNITHGGPNWPPMVQKRNVTHGGSDAYKGKCLKFFHLFWSAFLLYNIRNFGVKDKVQEHELLWKVHVWVSNKKAQALFTLTGVWILWKEGRPPPELAAVAFRYYTDCGAASLPFDKSLPFPSTGLNIIYYGVHSLAKAKNHCFQCLTFGTSFAWAISDHFSALKGVQGCKCQDIQGSGLSEF